MLELPFLSASLMCRSVEEWLIQDVGDEEAEQEKTTPSEKWTTNMITSKLHLPNHHPPPAASFVPACVQE